MVEYPLISRNSNINSGGTFYITSMQITGTDVLGPEKEDRICPIEMEEFDKAGSFFYSEDFVPDGTCFVQGRPDLCVATLKECGHRFTPMAIVYHMCLSGMQCPVCRQVIYFVS
jgi:hypothetical protein